MDLMDQEFIDLNTLEKSEKKDDSQAYNYQVQSIDSDTKFEIIEDVLRMNMEIKR